MASAGRILIMPKGSWNAETEYEMLDLVFHNGKSWLAAKISIGIEPSEANAEYWFKMCEIDLSEYATKADLGDYLKLTGGTLKGDLGLNNGNGNIISNEYGTMIRAVKDGHTYRGYKVDNPKTTNDLKSCTRLVDTINGETTEYKIFGEHNLELLYEYVDARIAEYLNNN